MARLRDVSTLMESPSGRGRAALGYFVQESPFVRWLDANSGFELDATQYDYLPANGSSTVQTRGIGDSYTENALNVGNRISGQLYLHGDAVVVDITHLADKNLGLRDVDAWFEKELKRRFRSFARGYEGLLFNGSGSGTPPQIKGLKTILDGTNPIPGFTETRVMNAKDWDTGDHLDATTDGGKKKLYELLMYALGEVDTPRGIICNRKTYARLPMIAREYHIWGIDQDAFGQPVQTFAGVPIVPVLDTTITTTEPNDAATPQNVTTSIYILSPGEMRFSLLTNSGLYWKDFDHTDDAEQGKEVWEIRAAWKIEAPEAVLRIRNIKV